MPFRSLVVITVAAALIPFGTAHAQPEADGSEAIAAPEGPAEGPTEPIPPPPAAAPEPEYTGKGLLYAGIGLTAFSWVSRGTAIGLLASGCTDNSLGGCIGKLQAAAAFTYLAPITQFVATGLVAPGAFLMGRHDAWRHATTGSPDRDGKKFVVAGAAIFGVFTALSIALRPVYLLSLTSCVSSGSGSTCGGIGGVVGYYIGAQVSDTASTAGAGLMSYGLGYKGYRKRYGPKVSVAPFSRQGAYGLSFSGQF
jgi:hypothetical protein